MIVANVLLLMKKPSIPSEGEKGEGLGSEVICIHMRIRARENIKVYPSPPFSRLENLFPKSSLRISDLQKSMKKLGAKIWRICCKAVILHPLSREKGDKLILKQGKGCEPMSIKTF